MFGADFVREKIPKQKTCHQNTQNQKEERLGSGRKISPWNHKFLERITPPHTNHPFPRPWRLFQLFWWQPPCFRAQAPSLHRLVRERNPKGMSLVSRLMCMVWQHHGKPYNWFLLTRWFIRTDPEALQHLAQHGVDAARVVFLDCDNHECNMVEGTKMADGWMMQDKFGHHYETSAPGHTSKLLMMEMEDTE